MQNPFKRDLSESLSADDNYLGSLDANVRIIIYADFTQPQWVSLHNTAMQAVTEYPDDVVVAYRHLPDTLNNPQAYAVAQALEATAKQAKFWDMVKEILSHQDQLTDGMLRQHARAIGVNKAQFEDDFSSAETLKTIKQHIQSAKDSKADSAPAIFINGVRQQTLSMRYIQELTQTGGNVMG